MKGCPVHEGNYRTAKWVIYGTYASGRGRRVIRISGSLTWSKALMELIFYPFCEFRWSPECPFSQIHSPHFQVGVPGIFSGLLRSVQMLMRKWGAESNGKLPYLFFPSKTAILGSWVYDGRSAYGQNCSLGAWVCSERPALGQNTLMMMINGKCYLK